MPGFDRSSTPRRAAVLAVALALALVSAPAAFAQSEPAQNEVSFTGTWQFEGHQISGGDGGPALFVTTGKAHIKTKDSEVEFKTRCLGASDQDTGGIARCTWHANEEDSIVIDLGGKIVGPMGTLREARGAIVAGSGRFAGAEGKLQLDWLFIDSVLEENLIKGSSSDIEGVWRQPSR